MGQLTIPYALYKKRYGQFLFKNLQKLILRQNYRPSWKNFTHKTVPKVGILDFAVEFGGRQFWKARSVIH